LEIASQTVSGICRAVGLSRVKNHFIKENIQKISNVSVHVMGVSGNTTTDLLARLENETTARLSQNISNLFIYYIGVNDTKVDKISGKNRNSIPDFVKNIQSIIHYTKSVENAEMLFILPNIIDEKVVAKVSEEKNSSSNFYSADVEKYKLAMIKKLDENQIEYLDFYEDFTHSKQDLLADGLHPNDAGHKIIADKVLLKIQSDYC